ncbi:MAG: hypothetical protein DWQ47_09555 [Acidobacteria bacterium]|nr:MAG: hypothetical protein DWQ32_17655 [Acidobacteriota bacterium]REJ98855.1 MAG: hypothetical protein DWQ38_12320 [Acidobacteriota bacterium]REK16425.1 MAG: hypothetical protein DWQ43_05365 [Acidobacteriota bacterium]REK44106.1 MAG: hypothetical protein DWQ47_09555 [Acidobacteriota bacterium]
MNRLTRTGGLKLGALFALSLAFVSCGLSEAETTSNSPVIVPEDSAEPSPEIPAAQVELLDPEHSESEYPIGRFDFRNHTYPLPRGWQEADGEDLTLAQGFRRTTENKIGMEYVTTKFFDCTGDGQDDAVVILKVGTAGSALPHLVYFYEWKDDKPELIWYFRTGDRADGGLKKIYPEDGGVVVELFGEDRYIFGEMETLNIPGDEAQLCCPTHFTKNRYKWTNGAFRMDGDRLTYSLVDPDKEPISNLGEVRAKEAGESR